MKRTLGIGFWRRRKVEEEEGEGIEVWREGKEEFWREKEG